MQTLGVDKHMKKHITIEGVALTLMLPGLALIIFSKVWFDLLKRPALTADNIPPGVAVTATIMIFSLLIGAALGVIAGILQLVKERKDKA